MKYLLLLSCILSFCAACTAVFPPSSPYSAASQKEDIVISFSEASNTLFIDVTSVSGVGTAEIQRNIDSWPQDIVLRMHLNGLEQFEFMYADTAVTLAISSQQDQYMQQSVRQINHAAEPLNPTSDFWMQTEIVNDDGTPGTIPLTNGSINMHVPQDFLDKNSASFTVSWIDFFR